MGDEYTDTGGDSEIGGSAESGEPVSAETGSDSADGALDDSADVASEASDSEQAGEANEPTAAETGSDSTDEALDDSADLGSDASTPEQTGEVDQPRSAEMGGDSTGEALDDSADLESDASIPAETGEANEPASAGMGGDSTGEALDDSADAQSDAPTPEQAGEVDKPASGEMGGDGTDEPLADSPDVEPDASTPEQAGEAGKPASAQEVADSTEKATEDKADTEPDTALKEETGDTNKPVAAQEAADSTGRAAEDKADAEPDAALEEELGEVKEPVSAKEVTDSTGKASEDKTESDSPSRAPTEKKESQADTVTDADVQRARDMVSPEEYSQYKDIYDSLDGMKLSPKYKDVLANRFEAMDPDLKGAYNENADQIKCYDSNCQGTPQFDGDKGFRFNQGRDLNNELGAGRTFFHESAHNIDWLSGHKLSDGLTDAVHQDCNDAIESIRQEKHCGREEAMNRLSYDMSVNPEAARVTNDVFGGATGEVQNFYHGRGQDNSWYSSGHLDDRGDIDVDYWNQPGSDRIGREAFAGITADRACGNTQSLEFLGKYMPKTMAAYDRNIKGRGRL